VKIVDTVDGITNNELKLTTKYVINIERSHNKTPTPQITGRYDVKITTYNTVLSESSLCS